MNQTVKYLSLLFFAIVISELIGKFFYFNSFKLFTFEIGYLSLIEICLFSLFIFIFQKIFNSFKDKGHKEMHKIKSKLIVLYMVLSFTIGLHFVGGEFQNFFILKKNYGPHMDMATFYDGIGHLILFSLILLIIFFLVKAELNQKNSKLLSRTDFGLLLFQAVVVSFFVAITIIKSAFIFLCLLPILCLTLFLFILAGKPQQLISRNRPIYTFFFSLLLFLFILLMIWLILPNKLKQPIIKEFISLGPEHKIETPLKEIPFLKLIMRVWE